MILDSKGNQVSSKPKPKRLAEARHSSRDGSCPECGADKEHMKPTLGGYMNCMKCGHQFKEERRD